MIGQVFDKFSLTVAFAFLLSGCASNPSFRPTSTQNAVRTELVFGEVSNSEWEQFLVNEVTPRFPDGLTWFSVQGQWRTKGGKIAKENSRILLLVHAGNSENEKAIETIRARFVNKHSQESVLRIDTNAQASF